MPQARGVYITLDRQIRRGGTEGPGCFGQAKIHSAECRARFEKFLAQERYASGSAERPAAEEAQTSSPSTCAADAPRAGTLAPDVPRMRAAPLHMCIDMSGIQGTWRDAVVADPCEVWRWRRARKQKAAKRFRVAEDS